MRCGRCSSSSLLLLFLVPTPYHPCSSRQGNRVNKHCQRELTLASYKINIAVPVLCSSRPLRSSRFILYRHTTSVATFVYCCTVVDSYPEILPKLCIPRFISAPSRTTPRPYHRMASVSSVSSLKNTTNNC